MLWQDLVAGTVVLVFALTTIPMIVERVPIPLWTSAPMTVGCAALAATFATLGLWYTVSVEMLGFALWSVLLLRGRS